MIERWGTCDIVLQEFVIQKTMEPCVYRFHRNARNVYKAECIIKNNKNRKSLRNDPNLQSRFDNIKAENKLGASQDSMLQNLVEVNSKPYPTISPKSNPMAKQNNLFVDTLKQPSSEEHSRMI